MSNKFGDKIDGGGSQLSASDDIESLCIRKLAQELCIGWVDR